jgi:hypothetical protein
VGNISSLMLFDDPGAIKQTCHRKYLWWRREKNRGGHGNCPKINFYFHFVVFLRGRLEKQVIIKVWPKIILYGLQKSRHLMLNIAPSWPELTHVCRKICIFLVNLG